MTFALITLGLLFAGNAFGLLVSLWLDRKGLPQMLNGQFVPRKPNTLGKRLPLIIFNTLLLAAVAGPSLWISSSLFHFEAPHPAVFVIQFAMCVAFDDIVFYWVHRIIHENKYLYRKIHKIHHEAYAPVPIEYLYVHPLEWMLGGLGPAVAIGIIMLAFGGMSAWTLWVWGAWRILHELDIHSGLSSKLGIRIPLFAPTEHHDLHHARPTLGNYASSLTLWDKVFGTEIPLEKRKPLKRNNQPGAAK